jgi:hypothetical protein
MSMKARINNAVDKAFNAIGDLKQIGTLTVKNVGDYDFNTQTTVSTITKETIELFIESKKTSSGEGFTTSALIKGVVDLEVYDSLEVGGVTYNVVDYSDNGFITEAVLKKEK